MPRPSAPFAAVLLPVALSIPGTLHAAALRSPQVVVCGSALQMVLVAAGEYANVTTDQVDEQVRDLRNPCTNLEITLENERAPGLSFGFYDPNAPETTRVEILSPVAAPGWTASVRLGGGFANIVAFDQNGVPQSLVKVPWPAGAEAHVGLYARSGDLIRYSQDTLDGGRADLLTFEGVGNWLGAIFDAFDLGGGTPACPDFADAVLLTQWQCGDPARPSTWGAIKTRYH